MSAMAFLQTFSAMTVAGLVWMGLFMAFSVARNESLNSLALWLSPAGVTGWLVYALLCVGFFFFARRITTGRSGAPPDDVER
jgi:hypothetical protein